MKQWLEREFEEEEITKALNDCAEDKAPGLDGFNFSFINAGWSFLCKDFYNMLSEFHKGGHLHKEINATFLTLIPKVPNPSGLKDFRPISLVGCVYNLLAKVLPNRLKVALPLKISPM